MANEKRIAIQNINVPEHVVHVDAEKYRAMRTVLLKVIPKRKPGITQSEMMEAVRPHLPDKLWPNGDKSNWWVKTVQLDLEAKGIVVRDRNQKPLRWYRVASLP